MCLGSLSLNNHVMCVGFCFIYSFIYSLWLMGFISRPYNPFETSGFGNYDEGIGNRVLDSI